MTPVNTTFYHDTLGKLRTVYIGDNDLYDENELYLIHRCDYNRLTYAFALLCHQLVKLCDKVDQLPVNSKTGRLHDLSSQSREVCENLLDNYGLTFDDMKEFDTDRIFEVLDEDVISPEDAGYMGREEITTELVHDLMDYLNEWKYSNGKSAEV